MTSGKPLEYRHKRSSERVDFPSTIEYVVDSPSADRIHMAVTVNISNDGIGAYVFSPHPEGAKIIIKTPLPGDCSDCRAATVRWIKKEHEDSYLIGLKCTDRFPLS